MQKETHNRSYKFSYYEKLHLQSDFNRVSKLGTKLENRAIKIIVYKTDEHKIRRLGLITPKRVGSAVERNSTKRKLREIFRTNKHSLQPGLDILFILKPTTASLDYNSLKKNVLDLLESAGFYKPWK